jgi:hypothetical protein
MRTNLPLLLMLILFCLAGLLIALAWAAREWLWGDWVGHTWHWDR